MPRLAIRAAAYLFLLREGKVCMIRRAADAAWMPGKWCLPAGHVEDGEGMRDCLAREALEEVGVIIDPAEPRFVHVQYRRKPDQAPYADFYFVTEKWEGEPFNAEPAKASALAWFPLTVLPEDWIPHQRLAFEAWQRGEGFADIGPV